ncbi:hypothetical protein SLAVM298S_03592 [Streptomyces lavendulae subsp. lavendulae]
MSKTWSEMLVAPHIAAAARARPAPPAPLTHHRPARRLRTHEGGHGFVREPREELYLLAVGNLVSQRTFYESGQDRDDRYTRLVRDLAVRDPGWTAGLRGGSAPRETCGRRPWWARPRTYGPGWRPGPPRARPTAP